MPDRGQRICVVGYAHVSGRLHRAMMLGWLESASTVRSLMDIHVYRYGYGYGYRPRRHLYAYYRPYRHYRHWHY